MAIELIRDIAYAPIDKVTKFQPQGHKVTVTAQWNEVPIHVTSGEMNSASRQDGPGTSYTTNVSARLKENISTLPSSILKITLCSGRVLILGTPHIPVKSNENISLSLTTFSINHNSIKPPLELLP